MKDTNIQKGVPRRVPRGSARGFRKVLIVFTNDNIENYDWIRNPFDVEVGDLAGRELEELAELSCDRTLKIQFREKSLSAFWLSVY